MWAVIGEKSWSERASHSMVCAVAVLGPKAYLGNLYSAGWFCRRATTTDVHKTKAAAAVGAV